MSWLHMVMWETMALDDDEHSPVYGGSGNKIDSYCCPCCTWTSHRNVISYLYEILICGSPRALLHGVVYGCSWSANSVTPALSENPLVKSIQLNQTNLDGMAHHIFEHVTIRTWAQFSVLWTEATFIFFMSIVCFFAMQMASCEITSFHYAVSIHGVVLILPRGERQHQIFRFLQFYAAGPSCPSFCLTSLKKIRPRKLKYKSTRASLRSLTHTHYLSTPVRIIDPWYCSGGWIV